MLRDKKLNSEDPNKGVFYADCSLNNRTEEPYFSCDCCSDCCDHTTEICIADDQRGQGTTNCYLCFDKEETKLK